MKKENNNTEQNSAQQGALTKLSYVLLAIIVGMILFNQFQIGAVSASIAGASVLQASGVQNSNNTGTISTASAGSLQLSDILPKGVPPVYGAELSVSYDDVSASNPQKANETIKKLAVFDTGISLSGDALQRYIAITTNISCEYCCGAEAITFANGNAACGCAHSAAMRGLAKYLLDKHASQYTNDQILEELGKWKTLFFPGNMLAKANVLKSKNIELNFINLGSNKYKGIEKGAVAGASQVGGC